MRNETCPDCGAPAGFCQETCPGAPEAPERLTPEDEWMMGLRDAEGNFLRMLNVGCPWCGHGHCEHAGTVRSALTLLKSLLAK